MKKLIRILFLLTMIIALSASPSCTDLDEEVYSTIISENFYKNEQEIVAAMVPAYNSLINLISGRGILIHEEQTTDILCPLTRDYGGWYDGGHSQKYHEHTWTPETGYLTTWWTDAYNWVNRANRLIFQFNKLESMNPELKATFLGELGIFRAFGYYYLLNSFGNVPIVDRFDVETTSPSNNADFNAGRKAVFEFIEKDLKENLPNLSEAMDKTTYGRFHKWAACALAVKLYMNAQVWTGIPRWDDAITYADMIINSGKFSIEADYFTNFKQENEGSKENIFVVPFHTTLNGGNMSNWGYVMHHHFGSQPTVRAPRGANNGTSAIPSHVKSFHPDDKRLKGWNYGPQYVLGTQTIATSTLAPFRPLVFTIDYINIYDPSDPVVRTHKNALEYNGARPAKYEINYGAGTNMHNDLPVYRYADILLLKAEALMRKNGGVATAEAVTLVNQVRSRSFADPSSQLYTTATLTLDALLKERAWELYYEGHRRNDLIRFGKFVRGTWEFWNRSGEGDYRNVFPIPQVQINANPNLKQNPGY
jgi:starch-binding outer membrane protein, SusD/RagB family